MFNQAKTLASQGSNIVLDATNIDTEYRKRVFENLSDYSCEFIACVLETDKERCLERIKHRELTNPKTLRLKNPSQLIDRYKKRFIFPTRDEGFDEIMVFDVAKQNEMFATVKDEKPVRA